MLVGTMRRCMPKSRQCHQSDIEGPTPFAPLACGCLSGRRGAVRSKCKGPFAPSDPLSRMEVGSMMQCQMDPVVLRINDGSHLFYWHIHVLHWGRVFMHLQALCVNCHQMVCLCLQCLQLLFPPFDHELDLHVNVRRWCHVLLCPRR